MAFKGKERAMAFERYLKSGSGRAFAQRHSHLLTKGPAPEERGPVQCGKPAPPRLPGFVRQSPSSSHARGQNGAN